MRVARVIVDVPTRALSEPLDYDVPEHLDGDVGVGMPVYVPLGRSRAVGYVVELTETSEIAGRRPIEAVLGGPLFQGWAPGLASWISTTYASPLSECLRLFLPPGGTPAVARRYRVVGPRPEKGVRAAVFDAVEAAGTLSASAIGGVAASAPSAASALVADGVLEREYRLVPPKTGAVDDRWAVLVPGREYTPPRHATMQRAVLDALKEGPARVSELTAELGPVGAVINRLQDVGAVEVTRQRRYRAVGGRVRSAPRHEVLTDGQERALASILEAAPGACVLLDGVTGSGKTEVYLRAIEEVLAEGGTAVVLVPEISLTPQTVGRFRSRFGEKVAVLHSRLSAGERFDQWDLVKTKQARVVVGPRSALFAPLSELRLVVIDEEHESSYKQGSAPRYHARAVAERLCAETGAVLVLGTATPSLETLARCAAGECERIVMPERVGGARLPEVSVVDMSAEFADGHRSIFSRPLLAALGQVADRREKALLFLNRRGHSSFLLCRDCGHVPGCDRCSVSMTYHERGARLMCHHCGAVARAPARCPECDSPYLRQFGAGTQRVESELRAAMPEMPIVRMDADTTRGKGGHERALAAFEELEWGTLVGTQMIAKGLDYPEVTLVGVLNADSGLHVPDFRAAERSYQLLAQVSGRAGRGERPGVVMVQTYWPEHPAIVAAAAHDPDGFYASEATTRRAMGYPPYGALANITLSGVDSDSVRDASRSVTDALRGLAPQGWDILGPAPAVIAKVKDHTRWHVMVKAPAGTSLGPVVSRAIGEARVPRGVSSAPDIDPYDLL